MQKSILFRAREENLKDIDTIRDFLTDNMKEQVTTSSAIRYAISIAAINIKQQGKNNE